MILSLYGFTAKSSCGSLIIEIETGDTRRLIQTILKESIML